MVWKKLLEEVSWRHPKNEDFDSPPGGSPIVWRRNKNSSHKKRPKRPLIEKDNVL